MELLQPSDVKELDGGLFIHGGTEVVPLLRDGILSTDTLVDVREIVPRGIDGTRIGAGTTLAELEGDPQIPEALREACRLAASPQLRNMGSIGGNLLQATRCWYWRLKFPCRLHGGDTCHAREGEHREHAIFGNDFCASAHPSDVAAALVALRATMRTNRRELPVEELFRLPTDENRDVTTLEPGELILDLDVPQPEASTYLKAMDRQRWSFPIVGVAAAKHGSETRLVLAGVAPIPWVLESPDALANATPLPGTVYKVTDRGSSRSAGRRGAQMRRLVLVIPLALLLVGCGGNDTSASGDNGDTTEQKGTMDCAISGDKSKAELATFEDGKTYEVVVDTSKGSFTFELATKTSPCTTASIAGLVEKGFFDGLTFHRIVPGFVIQGGDPAGDGTGGPGYSTVDAPPQDTKYVKGLVAMAKAGNEPAGTSGSQFFVVTGADVGLDPRLRRPRHRHRRLDVVEKIGALGDPNDPNGVPTERVEIKKMQLK